VEGARQVRAQDQRRIRRVEGGGDCGRLVNAGGRRKEDRLGSSPRRFIVFVQLSLYLSRSLSVVFYTSYAPCLFFPLPLSSLTPFLRAGNYTPSPFRRFFPRRSPASQNPLPFHHHNPSILLTSPSYSSLPRVVTSAFHVAGVERQGEKRGTTRLRSCLLLTSASSTLWLLPFLL
jgi:hypothetical protein